MTFQLTAAAPLLVLCAYAIQAAELPDEKTQSLDEIIVAEQTTQHDIEGIDVKHQILVDTATILKDIPGANVNQNGALTGIAQYRGMFGDRVAVTIDNHAIVSGGPNAMDTPLSYVSPMITESVIVHRGIASVSAAPESVGGHLTASLDRGRFGGDEFGVSGFAGSRYSSNGDVTTSAARFTVSDTTRRFSMLTEMDSGNDSSTPSGTIRPSQLHRDRYDLSYSLTNGDSHLVLFAGRVATENTGTPALPMDILKIDTNLFGGHFLYSLSPVLSIEGGLAANDVEHDMDNFTLREAPPGPMQRLNSATGRGRSFKLASIIEFDRSTLRVGIDGINADHQSTITNPDNSAFEVRNFSNVSRDLLAAFAEWTIENASSDFELGLQFKRVNANAGAVSVNGISMPAGAMLQDAFNLSDRDIRFDDYDLVAKYRNRRSDKLELQLEVARKSRAPSYQELYLWLPLQATGGLADGRSYIGDIGLNSEHSNEVNLGLTFSQGPFQISPQAFVRDVDGYIQGIPSTNMAANMMSMMMSGRPALQFANTDARIWGVDTDWNYMLSDALSVDGTITYVRGRRKDISDNLYRISPANANVRLAYQRTAWSMALKLSAYASQDAVSETNDETRTPGYAHVSTEFAWQATDSLRLEAYVHNLFDHSYADHLAGINRAMGSEISVGSRLPGSERSLMVGAILTF